jgi:MFS family permease
VVISHVAGLVGLLWIAFCLNYIDRQVAFTIFPALRRELGFSAAELGWVGTVFIWSYSLALPFAWQTVADRTDKRRMIAASLLLWSLAIWGSASAASVGSFLAWRAVVGLTEALYFPRRRRLHRQHPRRPHPQPRPRPPPERPAVRRRPRRLVGGWSADGPGWRYGFTTLALLGILYAFVLGFVLPKTDRADRDAAPGRHPLVPGFLLDGRRLLRLLRRVVDALRLAAQPPRRTLRPLDDRTPAGAVPSSCRAAPLPASSSAASGDGAAAASTNSPRWACCSAPSSATSSSPRPPSPAASPPPSASA